MSLGQTNQGLQQASVRLISGSQLNYNGDWSALFDMAAIPAGAWNQRLAKWLQAQLPSTDGDLPDLMQAYALSQGAFNWNSMGTFTPGGGGTAPVNTSPPVISGSTTLGSTLTCTPGTWTGSPAPTFTYQWQSTGVNVGTGPSYVTQIGDSGDAMTCIVTATNTYGSPTATSNTITMAAYASQTVSLLNAMTGPPTTARANLIDACISGMIADGTWGQLAGLFFTAAHNIQAGGLNWVGPGGAQLPLGAPGFTTDRGWAGDGSSTFVDTGYNTSAVAGWQNNHSMGCYCNTVQAAGAHCACGTRTNLIEHLSAAGTFAICSSESTVVSQASAAAGVGHVAYSRNASAGFTSMDPAGTFYTPAQTSTAPQTVDFYLGAFNNNGTVGSFSSSRIACFWFGAAMTTTQLTAMASRILTFLTAIGAN